MTRPLSHLAACARWALSDQPFSSYVIFSERFRSVTGIAISALSKRPLGDRLIVSGMFSNRFIHQFILFRCGQASLKEVSGLIRLSIRRSLHYASLHYASSVSSPRQLHRVSGIQTWFLGSFIDWFVHWLIDWIVRRLFDTFIDWFVHWLIDSIINSFIDWLIRSLNDWFVHSFIDWLIRSLID